MDLAFLDYALRAKKMTVDYARAGFEFHKDAAEGMGMDMNAVVETARAVTLSPDRHFDAASFCMGFEVGFRTAKLMQEDGEL